VVASDAELVELVATAARRMGRSERRWDHAHPELNLRLPNGDRLHALMAVTGRPVVTIRRHDFSALSRVAHLVDAGLFSIAIGAFLVAVVRARLSLIVAGGTGTGKTTSLRCLINEIPPGERLLTVEDSLELGLEHFEDLHPDYEAIEAREANTEGQGAFSLADGVRAGLRMNPDRVIVGEIRGGAELLSMLLAMSQGNDGSMCSLHADSSAGVFSRLAMYAAMTPERLAPDVTARLVAEAVQVVVHLGWVDGVRRVTSIREVTGVSDAGQVASNEVWRPGPYGRAVPHMPLSQPTLARLVEAGFDARLLRAEGGVAAMTTLGLACLAAGAGLGAWLILAGLRGVPVLGGGPAPARRWVASLGPTRAAGAGGAAVSALVLTGWPAAAVLVALGVLAGPGLLGGRAERRASIARTEAIAAWTDMVRDSIAAASGLEEAIVATAAVAPSPIRAEVAALVRRLDHQPLPDALGAFGAEVDDPCADLVALLSRLSESTRDEARMRVRVEVGRTKVRTATQVICGVLAASVVGLVAFDRSYLAAYDTPTGQVALVVVGGIFAVGAYLLQRMAHLELPERFAARTPGARR
jgi:Flp pilus assembly CpaF family ATPase